MDKENFSPIIKSSNWSPGHTKRKVRNAPKTVDIGIRQSSLK